MNANVCDNAHRYWETFAALPTDQGSVGRHKCAGCAWEAGREAGLERREYINLHAVFDDLPESQAGVVRHKSPHAAFALGYHEGVRLSYEQE